MKNVGCKFAVNQTVENAPDVFLMDIAALNAHFEPPVQKKTQGIKKLSKADGIIPKPITFFYENLHELT